MLFKHMEINSYNKICNIFNEIIDKNINTKNILNLPILHIQRNHDAYLDGYHDILNHTNKINFFFKSVLGFLLYFLWKIFEIFFLKKNPTVINKIKKKRILILSHLFKNSEEKYFKLLNSKLSKYQTIYINHVNSNKINNDKIIISERLTFLDELKILSEQVKLFSFFLKKFFLEKNLQKKKIYLFILSKVFHGSTTKIFRIKKNIKKILDFHTPKYFITTLEGFCHEKVIFNLKKKYPKCTMIGFQHNYIFNHYNSLLNNKITNTFPHKILTVSNQNKKILINKKIFLNKVINIGKTNSKLKKIKTQKNYKKLFCIFCPEGIVSESKKLFKVAYKIAEKQKNLNIILRLHPNLQHIHKKIINYQILKKLPNLKYSSKKLEYDLVNCHFGVYRGSHSVFDFIKFGICPIFFSFKKKIISEDSKINLIRILQKRYYFKVNGIKQLEEVFKKKISKNKLNINIIYINKIFDKFNEKKLKSIFHEAKN